MKMKEYKYRINGTKFTVGVGDIVDNHVQVEVNGTPYTVEIDTEAKNPIKSVSGSQKRAAAAPRTESGEKVIAKPTVASAPGAVKAPLPGTITGIKVNVGDTVNNGDTVCVLEAMKMENNIHSDRSGTVKQILVNVGDVVSDGADIMIVE